MLKLKRIILLTLLLTLIFSSIYTGKLFVTTVASNLMPGNNGKEVSDLQQRLSNWGYYKDCIDGNYGPGTFLAVLEFQMNHGLLPSGIAGTDTLEMMGLTRVAEAGAAYAQGREAGNEQLLARAINGEARGEPYLGQVAVGAVIINRTRDSKFPKTIPGVIYQPGAFTAVSDGQINVALEKNSTVVKAARDALNGFDPTSGCLYYWNPATATSKWIWSRQIVKKIGKHYFGK